MASFLDELAKTVKKSAEAKVAETTVKQSSGSSGNSLNKMWSEKLSSSGKQSSNNVWSESVAPKSIGGSSKSSGSGSSGGTSTKKQNNSFYEDYQARKQQQQSRARFTPSTLLGAQTKKQNSSFYDDYQARKKQLQSGRFTPSLLNTGSSARRFTPSVRRQPSAQDWSERLSPVHMRDMLSAETSAATQRRKEAVKQDILNNSKYRFTDLEVDSVINSQNPREDMTALVKRKGGSDTEARNYGEYVYYHLLDDTHKKQYNKDMDATERQGLGAQYTTDVETQKARTEAVRHMQNNPLTDPNSFDSKAAEKLRKGIEWGGKFAKWLGNSAMSGIGQFNNTLMQGLDLVIPTDFLGDKDPMKKVTNYYKGLEQGYANAAYNRAEELGGKGWNVATEGVATLTNALAQAATALMTGGTSTAGSLVPAGGSLAGSAAAAAINGVPTMGYTAANIAQNAMKTPSFWLSFLTEAGNQYEGAKDKGASETQAVLSGLVTGYLNGLVEVGGGIEAIPGAERGLKTFVKSSLEEGLEENAQGMIGNLVDKAVWDKDKQMFSLDDEDAVVNPKRMGEEFAGGALVGGVLGGVPMAVGYAADTNRLGQMYRDAGAVQDVIDEGKAQGTGTKAYRQAQNMNADTASNFRVGRQANLNAEAMTDEARLAQLINERTGYDVNYRLDMPSWNAGEIRGNDININANKGQRVDTVLHEVGHIDTPEAQAAADKTIEVLQKPEYKAQLDARLNTLKQFYDRQGVEYTEQMLLNEIAVDMRRGGLLYRTSADYDRATRTDNYDRDRFIPNTVRRATSTVRSVFGGTVTNENAGITVSAKDANTIREAWERADNASAGAYRTGTATENEGAKYSVDTSEQTRTDIDNEYLDAVNRGDMETAQRLVREQAERNGYSTDTDWRMDHHAPTREYNTPAYDLRRVYGEEIYSPMAARYYGDGAPFDQKAVDVIQSMKDNPEKTVSVYRAVPTSVKDTRLRNGDWVTITEDYAKEHGWRVLDDDYRIIKNEVPAKYLFTNGDSIHEFGYDNGQAEAYRNTENNAKSLDTVTYDDNGNIIPLSQRFNASNADTRYSVDTNAVDDLSTEECRKRFADNVDKVFNGDLPQRAVVTIGNTPEILRRYGASDAPITINQSTMYKIAYPVGYFGAEDQGHNLGIPALKQLPYQIANPMAIIKSNSQDDSLVILTEWKDTHGNPIIIPLHLGKDGALGVVNEVASAYGKRNIDAILTDTNGNSNVLYTKNDEDIHRLIQSGLQLPGAPSDDTLIKNSISQNNENVKHSVDTNAESEDAPPAPNEEDWENLMTGSEAERGIPPAPSEEDWNNLTEGGNAREQAERRTQIFMEQQGVTSPRELAPDTVTRRQSEKERSLWRSPSPVRKAMGKAYMAVVDDMHPFWNYNKAYERKSGTTTYGKDNPYKLSINAKDASSRAAYIVTDEMVDFDNNSIGKGLVDTITDSGITKDTYDEFNKYLVARHALEWLDPDGHGAVKNVYDDPRLNDMGVVQMMTEDFESAHPEFKQAADNLYEWQRKLMKTWLVDTGVITQEQYDTFTQMYPDYVPFFREQDTTLGRGKVGMANQGEVIKEAVGSESRRILEPIENIMYNVASYVNHGTKHEVIKTAVQQYDMLDSDPENNVLRQYWEEVVPVNPEQEQNLYFRPKRGDDPSVDDATNEGERSISSTLRQQSDVRNGIVSFLDNGKMRYFRVYDKDFLNVLDNVRKGRDGILAMFAAFSRTRAALITSFNPAFALASNPIRDFGTLITNSTDANKAKIAAGAVSSYYDIAKKSDAYKSYLAMGGQYSSVNTEGMTAMKQALQKLQAKDPNLAKRFFKLFPKGFGVYQTTSAAIEAAPRLGDFKSTLEQGYDYHEAFYRAKDVTVNFSRGGQIAKELNAVSNFFNASIQGVDKFFRQAKNNPKSFAIGITCLTVPALLAWAWNHLGDDKDKKEAYDNLSNYHKNNSYNFYIGNGKFISIPKARESAVITSSIEMALDKFLAGESDRDKDFFADYMLSQFLPDGSIIGLSTISDLRANKDYMDRPIVSDALSELPAELQYDDSTSYLAKWLGGVMKVSPKQIDHVINSETGVLGKINRTYFTPSSKDDKAAMYSFGVLGTYVKDSLFSTDNLNMFYDNKEKADKQANGYPSADTTYLSNKYTQASGVLSVLNKMYKENSQTDEGREIRKQYVRFARNNKDNPTGLSDEVYNEIKGLYDTDSSVVSLPKVDSTIKYDGESYTFDDAESVVNYRNDLNEAVDRAYRNLIKEVGYAVATDDEKVGTLLSAKDKAVKEVKQFYIENKGEKRMSFGKENVGKVEKPSQAEIKTAATQRAEQQERQAQFQEKASRVDPIIQSVAEGVAKASPDDASKYTADSLKIHRVNKMTVDGKEYEISDDVEQKIIADANDEYYTNLEKLQNNEINIEDIIGYTKKGKAHTSTQADGTKVALTGKLYNEDGTPRFDELVTARIYYDLKEAATNNAKAKYQDEITGAAEETPAEATTETPTETSAVSDVKTVSRANTSRSGGSSGGSRSGGSSGGSSGGGTSRVKFTPSGGGTSNSSSGGSTIIKFTPSGTTNGAAQFTPTASVASAQRFIPSTRETARQMRFIPRTENAVKPKEIKAVQPIQMI